MPSDYKFVNDIGSNSLFILENSGKFKSNGGMSSNVININNTYNVTNSLGIAKNMKNTASFTVKDGMNVSNNMNTSSISFLHKEDNSLLGLTYNKSINKFTYRPSVNELIELANRHPRVNILQPSPGVGGHCIAVDPWFIVDRDQKNSELIRKSRETNLKKTEWTIEKIKKEIHKVRETLDKNPSVAILGVSFKPNIDDLRESPSAYIAETLLKENYDIDVFEPNIESHSLFNIVLLSEFRNYDIVVGLVKHDEFMDSNFKQKLTKSRLLNFCGI